MLKFSAFLVHFRKTMTDWQFGYNSLISRPNSLFKYLGIGCHIITLTATKSHANKILNFTTAISAVQRDISVLVRFREHRFTSAVTHTVLFEFKPLRIPDSFWNFVIFKFQTDRNLFSRILTKSALLTIYEIYFYIFRELFFKSDRILLSMQESYSSHSSACQSGSFLFQHFPPLGKKTPWTHSRTPGRKNVENSFTPGCMLDHLCRLIQSPP